VPAFETLGSIAYGSRTNTTVPAPSGIEDGDALLLLLGVGQNTEAPDPTPPAGFTLVPGGTWPIDVTSGGFNAELYAYSKIADGESGDYDILHTGASTVAALLRVSDPGDEADFLATTNSGTGATTIATGLAVETGDLVVFMQFDFDGSGAHTGPGGTTPTFTERFDNAGMLVSTGVMAASGSTGNKSMTNQNGGAGFWAASLVKVPAPPPTTEVQARIGGVWVNTAQHTRIGGAWV
jgi:hypothetical protein